MKSFSSPGACLIVALAAGCSFDASQLRALPDGAVENLSLPDAGATGGGGGSTISRPDAATTTGGSGGAPVCTPPGVPINVAAVTDPNDPTSGNIYVTWVPADSGSTPTGYTVLRGTSATGPFTAASTNQTPLKYTDLGTNLRVMNPNGTTYYYEVNASNAGGTCVSDNSTPAVSAVSCGSPTVPTGTKATAGISRVTVSWTASTNGPTSYQVKRGPGAGGPFESVGTVTASPYVDSSVNNGTAYYYVVVARNANGVCSSADSGVVSTAPRTCTVWSGNAVNVGHPGAIGSTNGICYVTCDTITNWGCANTDGRSITINGIPMACGATPIPAAKTAGYNVIDVTAGTNTQATIFWSTTAWGNTCSIPSGGLDF